MSICRSGVELGFMREAGRMVVETHRLLARSIEQRITILELDSIVESSILSPKATLSSKGYNSFSGSICAESFHGIPGKHKLNEGDISIDIGTEYCGYHGDSAWTYGVSEITTASQQQLDVAEQSLYAGLTLVKSGVRLYNALRTRNFGEAG